MFFEYSLILKPIWTRVKTELKDRDFLRMLEAGCYNYVESVWDRYEFEHCNKLNAWKKRSNYLVRRFYLLFTLIKIYKLRSEQSHV